MLFPHPMNVNDLLKPIPKVQLMTIEELRTALAIHRIRSLIRRHSHVFWNHSKLSKSQTVIEKLAYSRGLENSGFVTLHPS